MLTEQQTTSLDVIGTLKQFLPLRLRGLCNELGLYVQSRNSGRVTTVKAGGRYIAKVHIQREILSSSNSEWTVKKYKSGDWEALIEPTFQLTCWIYDCSEAGALEQPAVAAALRAALVNFRKTGTLELPKNPRREGNEAAG